MEIISKHNYQDTRENTLNDVNNLVPTKSFSPREILMRSQQGMDMSAIETPAYSKGVSPLSKVFYDDITELHEEYIRAKEDANTKQEYLDQLKQAIKEQEDASKNAELEAAIQKNMAKQTPEE